MSAPRPPLLDYVSRVFPHATLVSMAGDASARRFYRVNLKDGSTRVVMDYGEPFAGEPADVRVNKLFRSASLRVATLLGSAPDPGCLILEDLGDRTLEAALERADGDERRRLYDAAVDLAAAVADSGTQALEHADSETWPALDEERFRFEMDYFVEHYVRGLAGIDTPDPELVERLHALATAAAGTSRRVLCHRDFHSRNLMVLPGGELAMVDIQDARWGPDTYDLASLLRDGYVDLGDDEVEHAVDRYRSRRSAPPEASAFRRRFDIVSAQRMLKALGTFGYQVTRLGRNRYLEAVPRTLARLSAMLPARSETSDLGEALKRAGLLTPPRR